MQRRTTIGIYGGSFNPIHTGHTSLGKWLCQEGFVDELWFLVSPLNPLKAGQELLDDNLRLKLAQLAVKESDTLRVSDFEMQLPKPSYMANTLMAMRAKYSEMDFALVIGADNWLLFDKWYNPEDILAHHKVLVYPRKGFVLDKQTLPNNVQAVDAPLFNISSTEIRNAIANGSCQGEWLHPQVWEEIKQQQLYGYSLRARGSQEKGFLNK